MTEFLHNAWSGWTGYTVSGKLSALLFAVLLYLWFGRKRKEQGALLLYTFGMTICCILPFPAAILMMYQTKFYNYEWIWSLVPMTAVTAYGITLFWTEYREKESGCRHKVLAVTLLLLAVLAFCGSMGRQVWDRDAGKAERAQAYTVLDLISERRPEGSICLWAPRKIMEYARERNAAIRLPYGRNMWDDFLNAYAYDAYGEELISLEQWMENVCVTGEANLEREVAEAVSPEGSIGEKEIITLEESVERALTKGVNCILIPAEANSETLERMERVLGTKGELLENFYLFFTDEEERYGRAD